MTLLIAAMVVASACLHPFWNLLIKGDRNLHYGQVREIMDLLAENGMTTLLLAADEATGTGGSN